MIRPRNARTAALVVFVLLASASSTFAAGTPEQRRACREDAMRLCRKFIPNVKRITACMEQNLDQLSPECRKQFK